MSEARDFNQGGEGMTVMTAENVLSHLSHPLGLGQRDKSGFYGTANGTRAGQGSLKALALNVLRRDSTWDESGRICTIPKWSLLSHPLKRRASSNGGGSRGPSPVRGNFLQFSSTGDTSGTPIKTGRRGL